MLKYISSIVLACSCIATAANAQSELPQPPSFTIDYSGWYQGARAGDTFSKTYSFIEDDEEFDINFTMSWSGVSSANQDNSTLVAFTSNGQSNVTLEFDQNISSVSFTIFALEGNPGTLDLPNIPGAKITNLFLDPNVFYETGHYSATGGWHGKPMATVTISNIDTKQLTLSFGSRSYQISSLNITMGGQIPEPTTYAALLGLAVAGVAIIRRRKAKA